MPGDERAMQRGRGLAARRARLDDGARLGRRGRAVGAWGVPLILRPLGLLVTAAPGTGSTALTSHLLETPALEAEAVPPADVVRDGRVVVDAKHATVRQLTEAGVLGADEVGRLRIVTSTRNPFDFWAAEWHRTRTRWLALLREPGSWVHTQEGMVDRIVDAVEQDFDTWLRHALGHHLEAGRCVHLNAGHVAEADVVLRMEHLDDDLSALLGRPVVVPHRNRTPDAVPYWQRYGVASRHLVERVHAPDLDRFGYRF